MNVSYVFEFGEGKVVMDGDEGSDFVNLSVLSDSCIPSCLKISAKDAEKLGAALFHLARTTEVSQ